MSLFNPTREELRQEAQMSEQEWVAQVTRRAVELIYAELPVDLADGIAAALHDSDELDTRLDENIGEFACRGFHDGLRTAMNQREKAA